MRISATAPGAGPERGLFVIWERGLNAEQRILDDIAEIFTVERLVRMCWSPHLVDQNFARFYRGQLVAPYSSVFADQKGRGPFTVVVVTDPQPRYELRDTTQGKALVSAAMFDAKRRYRAWTGGGMKVHGTETAAEAVRDERLLLGDTPETTGGLKYSEVLRRDLPGAHGWTSIAEVLTVLNDALTYVVLRNFEQLPANMSADGHDDVDLLTDDYHEAVRLLAARPLLGRVPRWGGRFRVRVAGADVIFDLRYVGDDYYDARWERRLLERRTLRPGGFYTPADDDYLASLAYHAAVHKREVAADYATRLTEMAQRAGRADWPADRPVSPTRLVALVRAEMATSGYDFVRPRDATVFYNYVNAGADRPWLRRRLAGLRREATVLVARAIAPLERTARQVQRSLVTAAPWLRDVRSGLSRRLAG